MPDNLLRESGLSEKAFANEIARRIDDWRADAPYREQLRRDVKKITDRSKATALLDLWDEQAAERKAAQARARRDLQEMGL